MDTVRSGWRHWLPGLELARTYRFSWLRHDLIAGIVLTALLVPQGMAYAELAQLPPITGLYATIVPLAVYALVGPSRILVLGPDSAVSPLIAAAIVPLAANGSEERVALAGMLALFVGALFVIGGIAKFGFITDLLSKPVRIGYLMGIALTVIVSQLPKLFGFSTDSTRLVPQVRDFVSGLDATNGLALAIGVACLAIILACRRWAPKVPGVFIAMVGATIVVGAFDLTEHGVAVVGVLPEGLPSFSLPRIDLADVGELSLAAIGIAFVAFADTSVLSRSYAGRLGYDVDQNHELVAMGAANAAAGLFQGFPISTSSSRTAVAETVGSKTQLTGLVGAVALALVLLFATGLVKNLPSSALAAVVITAVLSLIDLDAVRRLRYVRRSEFELAIVSFAGVALVGVLAGIGIAIVVSLLNFIRRAWRPHDAVLGRAHGLKGYHDVTRYPGAQRIPGLVLYRFDAPLFFANADYFRARVRSLVEAAGPELRWFVVASEPITDVDATAAEMLEALDRELESAGVELAFAELKDPVRDRLTPYGLTEQIGRHRFFPTVGAAVRAYLTETGTEWVDWEDATAALSTAGEPPRGVRGKPPAE
jgi:high affinity sulfate transporter 1